ncbi:hypothetical protein HN51_021296 [Arachis hypogaea]|uniref:Glycosyltransferase n=1 Tax=Arachis hypogaea TaxID=3818 RepID=A0A445EH68_ARAHY|nr:hydroquinone glucosyltransferase [Arachis hypogaea]RYR74780.1 hypothetical protein Ahy_A02g009497 [Arachis hypogaea]
MNMELEMEMKKKTCIAMVPCPGHGHLIPLLEFAKRFLLHHRDDFHVTFLIPTLGPPSPSTIAIINTLPSNIDFTFLPPVNVQDLHIQTDHPVPQMVLTVRHTLPSLKDALASLSSRTNLVALVLDVFSLEALHLAKELNISSYLAFASGAATLSFTFSFPKFDKSFSSEFESQPEFLDLERTMDVPGCDYASFKVKDLPDPVLFLRSGEIYTLFLSVCQKASLVDGIIVNTFNDLEPEAMRALHNGSSSRSVYAIGPIVAQPNQNQDEKIDECVAWLNHQPSKSVLYICFGSGGTLSQEQVNEIAFGLELSGHKFLWVVRVPNKIPNSGYVIGQKEDPIQYLPPGFVERTKEQGLVVPSWAPQIEILAHGSTGGFLSHCGWNSTLESIVHGVPMIAWPLFAEQRMNAILLTDVLRVAVRPQGEEDGVVNREEIAKVVKRIMDHGNEEGLEMRKRTQELSYAAAAALSENGSSTKALSSLAHELLNKNL